MAIAQAIRIHHLLLRILRNLRVDLTIYTFDPFRDCEVRALHHFGNLRSRGQSVRHLVAGQQPYLLVDDVVVPEDCSLTVGPGVIILGDSLDIGVGALYANGTAELPIEMTVGELLSHTAAENAV